MKTLLLSARIFLFSTSILIGQEKSAELNQANLLMQFIGDWKIELDENSTEYVEINPIENGKGLDLHAKWVNSEGVVFLEAFGFWGYDTETDKIDISIFLSSGNAIHCLGLFNSEDEFVFYEWSKNDPSKKIRKYHFTLNSNDHYFEVVTDLETNNNDEYHWHRLK